MTLLEFWRAGFIARHVALKGLLKDTLYLVFKDRFSFNESGFRCSGFILVARQSTFSRPQAKRDFKPPRPLCQARQSLTHLTALALPSSPNFSIDSALTVEPESDERLGGFVASRTAEFCGRNSRPLHVKTLEREAAR